MVFPPEDISNYEYELFVLVNIMRMNPELFVTSIVEKYKGKFAKDAKELFDDSEQHLKNMMQLNPLVWHGVLEKAAQNMENSSV